jgi:hypothetical protein
MKLGGMTLKRLTFPGQAGTYQRGAATPALVRELADNYDRYHEFLRRELAKFGKPPEPSEYPNMDAYLEAWTTVQDIVKAEAILRNCVAFRETGRPLDSPADTSLPPLVDSSHRLVSFR